MDTRSLLEIRALRYLAQREHSRRELAQKLSARKDCGETAELTELTEVLDKLEQQGFLSEQRMVEQVARIRRSRFGSQRIIHELKAKGIDDHLIDGIRPALQENELEAAFNIWRKKFHQPPATRWPHGFHPYPGRHFDRTPAKRRAASAAGALGIDAERG